MIERRSDAGKGSGADAKPGPEAALSDYYRHFMTTMPR